MSKKASTTVLPGNEQIVFSTDGKEQGLGTICDPVNDPNVKKIVPGPIQTAWKNPA